MPQPATRMRAGASGRPAKIRCGKEAPQKFRDRSMRDVPLHAKPSRVRIGLVLALHRDRDFVGHGGDRDDRPAQAPFLQRLADLPRRERRERGARELAGDGVRFVERVQRAIARVKRVPVKRHRTARQFAPPRWQRALPRHPRLPRRFRRARTPWRGTGAPSPRWPATAAKAGRRARSRTPPAIRDARGRRAVRRKDSARSPPRADAAGAHRRAGRARRPSPPTRAVHRRCPDPTADAAIRRRRDASPRGSRSGAPGAPDRPRYGQARGTGDRGRANRRDGAARIP